MELYAIEAWNWKTLVKRGAKKQARLSDTKESVATMVQKGKNTDSPTLETLIHRACQRLKLDWNSRENSAPIMSLTLGNKQSLLLGEGKYVDRQPSCGTGMQRWLKLDNSTLTLRITLQHLVSTLSTKQQEQFLETLKPMVH